MHMDDYIKQLDMILSSTGGKVLIGVGSVSHICNILWNDPGRRAINVEIEEFKGVKLIIKYTMSNIKTNETVLIGKTKHCFVSKDNKPIILKKDFPEFDKKLKELVK